MGFSVFRGITTTAICILLLALFIVPSRFLRQISDRADVYMDETENALRSDNFEAAQAACDALLQLYEDNALALERFLNHGVIDAFGSAVAVTHAAISQHDANAALETLAEMKSLLARIRGIELFSPNSLL